MLTTDRNQRIAEIVRHFPTVKIFQDKSKRWKYEFACNFCQRLVCKRIKETIMEPLAKKPCCYRCFHKYIEHLEYQAEQSSDDRFKRAVQRRKHNSAF